MHETNIISKDQNIDPNLKMRGGAGLSIVGQCGYQFHSHSRATTLAVLIFTKPIIKAAKMPFNSTLYASYYAVAISLYYDVHCTYQKRSIAVKVYFTHGRACNLVRHISTLDFFYVLTFLPLVIFFSWKWRFHIQSLLTQSHLSHYTV